jgi:hypothetical protein
MIRRVIVLLVALCISASAAFADPAARLAGRVVDSNRGTPVEDTTVLVAGPTGVVYTFSTDANGKFSGAVEPGAYTVIFVYGTARTAVRVTVAADRPAWVAGKVDSTEGEVIVIREKLQPPVPAKPIRHQPLKAPPYSNRAINSDAWTRAFLLLDIDETGALRRIKWLKRPGYDLDAIALSEVKKVRFAPARDSGGKPIRSLLVWDIEWPSAWWLNKVMGTRVGLSSPDRPRNVVPIDSIADHPGARRPQHLSVPCKGSGPWRMESIHQVYRDCSKADLRVAAREPWFAP